MTDQEENNIQDFLNNIPDQYEILEKGIDIEIQKEYIEYSHSFGHGELTEEETLRISGFLFDNNRELEAKKKALSLLAHSGTVAAFRQIEKYYKKPDKGLEQWAAFALQECKMFLEISLTEESSGFISTGLGGQKDKLRCYFLILPSSNKPFTTVQINIIQDEINIAAKSLNCIVESYNLSDIFVALTALIPMDLAADTFIMNGIRKCNELGGFVSERYYVTNQSIPNNEEIKEIIKIVKGE